MDYQKIYYQICQNSIKENRKKASGVYYEKHHIVPKCLGGDNTKQNLVLLTAKEHYICHLILYYLHPNNRGLALAYTKFNKIHKKGANQFSKVRQEAVKRISGHNNPMYGKTHSDSVKKKISQVHKGKKISDELKQIWSVQRSGENNWWKGKNHSEESKNKMRKPKLDSSRMRKPKRKLTCPHCNKIGGTGNMQRWHFDNCKEKNIL